MGSEVFVPLEGENTVVKISKKDHKKDISDLVRKINDEREKLSLVKEMASNTSLEAILDQEFVRVFPSLILDSMKCYLKHRVNFDLFGSDARDDIKNNRGLNIKRIIFPLRNSTNIILSEEGIKFIDADTIGRPGEKFKMTARMFQNLLFLSSAVNYLILSAKLLISK